MIFRLRGPSLLVLLRMMRDLADVLYPGRVSCLFAAAYECVDRLTQDIPCHRPRSDSFRLRLP